MNTKTTVIFGLVDAGCFSQVSELNPKECQPAPSTPVAAQTLPQRGWYLKYYWLNKSPQQGPILANVV